MRTKRRPHVPVMAVIPSFSAQLVAPDSPAYRTFIKGRKDGQTVKKRRGTAFFKEIGQRGGEATKRTQGFDFYSRIGKVGGETGKRGAKRHPSA